LQGGRRPNRDLSLADGADAANFCDGRQGLKLHQYDDRGCSGNWCGGVQDNAERAVIDVGIDGVDVGYLDDSQQGKKRKTDQCHYVGPGPRASIASHP